MNIYSAITMTCRDATYLHQKKQEGKLSVNERLGLWVHLVICKFCRRFFNQSNMLQQAAKHTHPVSLSHTAKQKMQQALNKELGQQ